MPRLLIVDDDSEVLDLYARYFGARGYDVMAAGNGAQAVEYAGEADLVLIDKDMPVMDGITALKLIRERFPRKPVIMQSADLYEGKCRKEALAAGALAYFKKPVSFDDLERCVERALAQ